MEYIQKLKYCHSYYLPLTNYMFFKYLYIANNHVSQSKENCIKVMLLVSFE